jgi:hypothetical protein
MIALHREIISDIAISHHLMEVLQTNIIVGSKKILMSLRLWERVTLGRWFDVRISWIN